MDFGPAPPQHEQMTSLSDAGPARAESEFERLTMPFLADVARFARSLTRDADRASDLVQDTYLRALRGWHTFQAGADPKRWLFTVCHHAFLRTSSREARYVDAPDDPELDSMATARAHWAAQQSGVVNALERMDLGPAIDRALDALAEHFRAAVVVVDVEGQSYEEAAAVLAVPVGTVRSRLFRGRRILQDLLFEYARDAGFRTIAQAAASTAPSSSSTPSRP